MKHLSPTIDLTHEFCDVLTDMERSGMHVDLEVLESLEVKYLEEYKRLQGKLERYIIHFMGDTPINLSSSLQLSQMIYSRKVEDKELWRAVFGLTPNMTKVERLSTLRRVGKVEFIKHVKTHSSIVYKTKLIKCKTCDGSGKVTVYNKDGAESKRKRVCSVKLKEIKEHRFATVCDGKGYLLIPKDQIGGLGCIPQKDTVSSSGFSVDKETLERLVLVAKKGPTKECITSLLNYAKISNYLGTVIPGIKRGVLSGLLHPTFNQAVTATGRLSSTNPNVQNFPRGGTTPVKRVFTSRWKGGKILEVDYSGLEFVAAVELSGDERGIEDVQKKKDKHTYTMNYLYRRGQTVDRTGAKPHTFKPLYGGSSGTPAEQEYYKHFFKIHPGISEWHKTLIDEAVRTQQIMLPTGRVYKFLDVVRTAWGCTSNTIVKNYPVQGFATADIVPCAVVSLSKKLEGYKSVLINTVHDSALLDVHPSEVETVPRLVHKVFTEVPKELLRRYGYVMKLPLRCEVSMGKSWYHAKPLQYLM